MAREQVGAAAGEGAGVSRDIVFLAHRVPYPPNRGDKIRSWNILKALARIAPVHVVALCDDPADMDFADHISTVAASVTLVPHQGSKLSAMAGALMMGQSASVRACASAELQDRVHRILASGKIGAIYAFSGQMAQFVPEKPDARFVMDFVDMDSAKFATFADQASGFKSLANRFEARRLFAFEKSIASRADVSLFVSEAEAALFRAQTGLGAERVRALENGIDLDHFGPDHAPKAKLSGIGPLLVFTGQMDYAPNVDAVRWFEKMVLPQIPNARFAIVGRAPTAAVSALSWDKVYVTGEVDDTRDWIAAADVVVAPLLLARGIQNKVLEAMAMGKAVVASAHAAEGIDAQPGAELLVAKDAAEFASQINALLADAGLQSSISQAARKRMEARYSWDSRLEALPRLVMP